jgi:hypothetical protein
VVELWRTDGRTGRWTGPLRPARGASSDLTQIQPRLAFSDSSLYASYLTVSRTGDTSVWLSQSAGAGFRSQRLPGSPFRFAGWLGDYQALALAGTSGYALWNSAVSGRLEIVAAGGRQPPSMRRADRARRERKARP